VSIPVSFKPVSGCWFDNHGKMMWKEFLNLDGSQFKLYDPMDLAGISREADFVMVLYRDEKDPTKFKGSIRRYFSQSVHVQIRDDVSDDIVLRFNERNLRYYLSDLKPNGQTFLAPLRSDNCLVVTLGEPELINQIQANGILVKYGYGYMVKENSDELYKTV
jgi:hypothetical protein